MANDINTLTISGRLTADAQAQTFQNGGAVAKFSVAVNRSTKGQDGNYTDVASFFNVNYSSKGAANFSQYLKKGTQVMIKGYLVQDRWQDKNTGENRTSVSIKAEEIVLGNSPNNQGQQQGYSQQQNYQQTPQQQYQQPAQNYQQVPQQQYQQPQGQMPVGVQQGVQGIQQPQQYQQQNYQQTPQQQYQAAPMPNGMNGFPDEVPF